MSGLPASSVEPSPARKALTTLALVALLFVAVVVQLTVVNRLPLPGGAVPDLVLLLVTGIGVCTTPLAGALAGFAGGLALDVAPPAIHYAGEYALVFCLAGWGAARVNRAIWDVRGERDPMITFSVMAGAAVAGEAGKAALGMMLADPDVTRAVAGRVLPAAILYDLLAAPFVFWLVARITRGTADERAPVPEFSRAQRLALVFRQASTGAAPNLRLAGSGENYHQPPAAGRVPRLRLSGGRAGSSATGAGARGSTVPLAGGRTPRLSFAGDLPARTAPRASRGPGKNWLRGAAVTARAGSPALGARAAAVTRRASRGPAAGWLTAAGASGPAGAAARRAARTPGQGWITAGSLAGPAGPPAVRGPGRGWITTGSLAGPAGPPAVRGPGRGWITAGSLAGPAAKRASRTPGHGWITAASPAGPAAKRASRAPGHGWITAASPAGPARQRAARTPGQGWITTGSLAGPAGPPAVRGPGRGWITTGSLAGRAGQPAARGPGRGWLRAAHLGGSPAAGLGGPRSAADALAARSAPSGLSALSGGGTPMAARSTRHGVPRAGWIGTSRSAAVRSAPRLAPRRGWLGGTGRPSGPVLGGGPHGPAGWSGGGRRVRAAAFRGTRAKHGNWFTAGPSGEWLRPGRHPRRKRGYLPGGRPAVPSGARPVAKGAIVSAARRLGLFGGRW